MDTVQVQRKETEVIEWLLELPYKHRVEILDSNQNLLKKSHRLKRMSIFLNQTQAKQKMRLLETDNAFMTLIPKGCVDREQWRKREFVYVITNKIINDN